MNNPIQPEQKSPIEAARDGAYDLATRMGQTTLPPLTREMLTYIRFRDEQIDEGAPRLRELADMLGQISNGYQDMQKKNAELETKIQKMTAVQVAGEIIDGVATEPTPMAKKRA